VEDSSGAGFIPGVCPRLPLKQKQPGSGVRVHEVERVRLESVDRCVRVQPQRRACVELGRRSPRFQEQSQEEDGARMQKQAEDVVTTQWARGIVSFNRHHGVLRT
jgi:hypothetical protein